MTPNLIELIVQAVKEAAHSRNYITGITITEDSLRTALASIPEMPQVDEPKATEQNLRAFLNGFFSDKLKPDESAIDVINFLKNRNLLRVLPDEPPLH